MNSTVLTEWLNINSLLFSILRIIAVWLAFYAAGSLMMRFRQIKKHFMLMPVVIPGMLVYMCIAVLLSLFQLLTRQILSLFVIAGAIIGLVAFCFRLRKLITGFSPRLKRPLMILPLLLAGYIMLTNVMIAGRPNMFQDDAHVTYMVQPDRWLNDGQIYFLEETGFSGFPMTAELLFLMPSSMSADRIDQLILSQLFIMSMLFASIFLGWKLLNLERKWFPAIFIGIAGCYQLVLWGHMAKPDIAALFFVTLALLILLRQTERTEEHPDLSAFAIMGLALSTKQTAYLTLFPFIILAVLAARKNRWSKIHLACGALLTAALPLIFAFRTMLHTGSPFYPRGIFKFMLKPEWVKPELDLTFFRKVDRSSEMYEQIGFIRNIWHYFREWGSGILLLTIGYLFNLKTKQAGKWTMILTGIAVYSILSLVLFYPAWWGAKYGILLIPFAVFIGIYLLRNVKHSLVLVTCIVSLIFFLAESPLSPADNFGIIYRTRLMQSYFTGDWNCEKYSIIDQDQYTPALQWMNAHLPDGSRILSTFARKRYLSDHEFYVLERHPVSSRLLCENTLEREIEILKTLEIDYILVSRDNPLPFDAENTLEILTRIGPGDVLEPVAGIHNYIICKFQPSNYRDVQ